MVILKNDISGALWEIYEDAKSGLKPGEESNVSAATLSFIRAFEQDLLDAHNNHCAIDTTKSVDNVVAKFRRTGTRSH